MTRPRTRTAAAPRSRTAAAGGAAGAAPRTVLVAGGGIAGAATALALHKAGLEPVVFEAHPGSADDVGAFLTLGSNGLEALRRLDADGPALGAGFPTPAMTLRSGTGKRLGAVPASTSRPGGATSRTLMRGALARLLLAEAERRGVRVERGRRLVGAAREGERVVARFADGGEAAGDLLIGADGVHSSVRRLIDPAAPRPRYGGLLNTGGRTRGVRAGAAGHYELIFGRRAFFGHVAAPDGEVWWFANLPWPQEPSAEALDALRREDLRARLLGLFAGDAGPATALIEAGGEPMPVSPIHSLPHLPRWHDGRMVVVGDAAHAPSPSSGQGASLAIEDAVVLATCLRDIGEPEAALARFEQIRRPRVERIIRWAERVNSSKAAGPVGRRVRDAVLPLALRVGARSGAHEQTYGHRVEWDAAVSARS
jgi:2-polyprenyl-6-methoxyphenol hydroxylase-like FAD-dependent oxidoreductase